MTEADKHSLPPSEWLVPSVSRRLACWLYEGVLLFGVLVTAGLAYFILAYWTSGLGPGDVGQHPMLRSGFQATCFLSLGIYFIWFWSRGQTLAMKTWHIRVVDTAGRPLSRTLALTRYMACWLWFLPPLLITLPLGLPVREVGVLTLGWVLVWALLSRFHPQRQFLHDALAGTRLITHR
ncbi:RDD family protein [Limnohabitans radicicola]|uniref:RDD family protein n=1 Tax=Limnohabitans radicicola TaxID=2771427 RepID=A0A927FDC1_9BURK|nr:RDD family protein [Limnohabitans radicicola]MBD8049021.1 RDD family protein [Limnohabitans radicicola]